MTIRSVILGLSPYLYWPLDDATGPAASDASGNGRPGAYGGTFSLQAPGPESGTYGAAFFPGFVTKAAPSYIQSGQACTLMCWAAFAQVDPGTHILLGNSSATKGGSAATQPSGASIFNGVIVRNAIASTSSGFYLLDGDWHHYAITFSNTATLLYVDGAQLGSAGAVNAFDAGVAMLCGGGYGYFAHFAAWNSTLSQANVQSVYSAPAAVVQPAFASQGQANTTISTDLTSVLAKLDQIIAAVIRTYTS